jgi:hypothetical protein
VWLRGYGVGHDIQQRTDRGHPGDAVGDDVVQPDEQTDAAVRQARQEPHLPQRP